MKKMRKNPLQSALEQQVIDATFAFLNYHQFSVTARWRRYPNQFAHEITEIAWESSQKNPRKNHYHALIDFTKTVINKFLTLNRLPMTLDQATLNAIARARQEAIA